MWCARFLKCIYNCFFNSFLISLLLQKNILCKKWMGVYWGVAGRREFIDAAGRAWAPIHTSDRLACACRRAACSRQKQNRDQTAAHAQKAPPGRDALLVEARAQLVGGGGGCGYPLPRKRRQRCRSETRWLICWWSMCVQTWPRDVKRITRTRGHAHTTAVSSPVERSCTTEAADACCRHLGHPGVVA